MIQTHKEEPVVAVVGAGAIGRVLASVLHDQGVRVGLIGRGGPELTSWVIETAGNSQQIQLDPLQDFNLVFICVKAYQLNEVLQQNLDTWQRRSVQAIICLSNGIVDFELGEKLRAPELRLGLTTMAVSRKGREHRHFQYWNPDTAKVLWGRQSLQPTATESHLLGSKGLKAFQWSQDADFLRRRKWLFNTALNPICAKYRLLQNRQAKSYQSEVEAVFHEAYVLGERLWGAWPEFEQSMLDSFWELVEQTGDNRNSMVADLLAGRETEVEYLSGLYRYDSDGHYPALANLSALWRAARNKTR